jgi:dTDP-glucose 4,6-dehydratase
MRVLVTGGAGFVGSHLVDRLLADGAESIIVVDNLSTGRAENLSGALADRRVRLIVDNAIRVAAIDFQPLDRIYHLASPASPSKYRAARVSTIRTGALATLAALDLADGMCARVLLASTSEVYGSPAVSPQPESYWGAVNPVGDRSCYDEGKRYAEAATVAYVAERGLDARIARIFNTYGPRMDLLDGRLVPETMRRALAGLPARVEGDGSQTRSLCFVADLVDGLVRLMESDRPEVVGAPVNLGSNEELPVSELARVAWHHAARAGRVSVPYEVEHVPGALDDPPRRCPDLARARLHLGWSPTTSLFFGLTETALWAASQANARAGG